MQPLLDVVERLLVGHVVDDNDTMSAPVVRGRDGTEAFLSGRVPNLELDGLAVQLNGADFLLRFFSAVRDSIVASSETT